MPYRGFFGFRLIHGEKTLLPQQNRLLIRPQQARIVVATILLATATILLAPVTTVIVVVTINIIVVTMGNISLFHTKKLSGEHCFRNTNSANFCN